MVKHPALFFRLGRDNQGLANLHQNGAKGLGDSEPVPALETPEPPGLDMKGHYWRPGLAGEPYRSWLHSKGGSSGAIRSKRHIKPLLHFPLEFEKGFHSTLTARTARGNESELFYHPGDNFPVKMSAGHHNNASKPPEVRCTKDLVMPERVNDRFLALLKLGEVLPPFHSITQRRSNQLQ